MTIFSRTVYACSVLCHNSVLPQMEVGAQKYLSGIELRNIISPYRGNFHVSQFTCLWIKKYLIELN